MSENNKTSGKDNNKSIFKKVSKIGSYSIFGVKMLTGSLTRSYKERKKDAEMIADLYKKSKEAGLVPPDSVFVEDDKTPRNDSYDNIFKYKTIQDKLDLLNRFNKKKAIYLLILYFIMIFQSISLIEKIFFSGFNNYLDYFFMFFSFLIPIVVFGTLSSFCEFKIWQIRNKRLSIEEKGGFEYFFNSSSFIRSLLLTPSYTEKNYEK